MRWHARATTDGTNVRLGNAVACTRQHGMAPKFGLAVSRHARY